MLTLDCKNLLSHIFGEQIELYNCTQWCMTFNWFRINKPNHLCTAGNYADHNTGSYIDGRMWLKAPELWPEII